MKKHIAEDLPARKYAAAGADQKDRGDNKEAKSPEKRVQQAVYDIRYRARREKITLQQAFSQYMQHSSMTGQERTLIKQKLFGKSGMQAEDFKIDDFASTNVANALYKVFVEGAKVEEPIRLTYMEKMETAEHKKYLVRVEDKNGRGYTRRATREKINQLRANPNIQRVEIISTDPNKKTAYGDPYEGEASKGELTAKATAGKDYDGDGKVESGAKEHAGAVHNAIQRKKGGVPDGKDTSNVKEEYLADAKSDDAPIGSKRRKRNKVTISPEIPGSGKGSPSFSSFSFREDAYTKFLKNVQSLQEKAESQQQQKLFGLALSVKRGETPRSEASAEVIKMVDSMSEKQLRDYAKTKHKGLPVHKEECGCDDEKDKEMKGGDDPRSLPTTMSLIKARLRSKGIKDPMMVVSSYEPDGEMVDENRRYGRGGNFNTPGRGDRTGGRYRNLGSPTDPKEIAAQEREAAEARRRHAEQEAAYKARKKNEEGPDVVGENRDPALDAVLSGYDPKTIMKGPRKRQKRKPTPLTPEGSKYITDTSRHLEHSPRD